MTPVKPIIGITPSHNTENDDTSLRPTYPRAIRAAGGLTILLPLEGTDEDWRQLAAMCDGFLFSGGPDLHPFLFGDETHSACGNVSPVRDSMEIRLLKAAMELKAHFRYLPGHTAFKCGSWRNHLPGYPKPDGANLSSGPQAALLLYRTVSSCGYKKGKPFIKGFRRPGAYLCQQPASSGH